MTALLDVELSIGPYHTNLDDLKFSQDLQDDFNEIAKVLLAAAVFYILGAAFSGLSLLSSLLAMVMWPKAARVSLTVNIVIAFLAWLTLLVGNLVVTVGARKGTQEINEHGNDIGLSATAGKSFLGISWAAFGLMVLTSFYWAAELFRVRRGMRHATKVRPVKESYSMDSDPRN